MILPNNKVTFTPNSLLIMGGPETIIIDEKNFEALQNAVREIFCLKSSAS